MTRAAIACNFRQIGAEVIDRTQNKKFSEKRTIFDKKDVDTDLNGRNGTGSFRKL